VALTKIGFTLIKDNFKDSVSGSSTEHSSSFSTRVTDLGLYLSGSGTLISGSAISTGSFGAANIAGMSVSNLVDFSSSIASRVTDEESDFTAAGISGSWQGVIGSGSLGMVSGSAISTGSFGRVIISEMGNSDLTDVSASISTRVNLLEGSGSITESSASFSTRVNLLEGSGSITESSASFSTRVNLLEGSGSINDLVTASGSFSTRVSDLKTDSGSFSTRVTTAEASGALFDGDGVVTFAGATITGTLTAQEVHTEFISASVTVSTGSNIFGDETGDVHQFTGSIETSGSIILDTLGGNVSGSIVSTGSFGAANVAGMTVSNLVDVSSSLSSRLTDVKTESGSFAAVSSSYSSASGSFSTRVTDLVTDSGSFSTRVSDLVTDSGSFSTRVSYSNLYLSGSGTIISGSSVSTGSFGSGHFTGTGGVGIGTAAPLAKLQVNGVSGTNPVVIIKGAVQDTVSEFIRVGRSDSTVRYHSIKTVNSATAASNFLSFEVHDTSGTETTTEVLKLKGDGDAIFPSGSVGIGTATPGFAGNANHTTLSILNSDTTADADRPAILELAGNNKGNGVRVGQIDFWQDVDGGDDQIVSIVGAQDGTTSNNVGGKLRLQTKADAGSLADRLVIGQDGKVGIGTVSPSQLLNVEAADGVSDNTWVTWLQNKEATDDRNYGLRISAGSTASDTAFFVQDHDASNDYFIIRGNGKVGIGTTSPDYLVEIEKANGDHTSTALSITNSQAGGYGSVLNFVSQRSDSTAHAVAASIRTQGEAAWDSDANTDSNLFFSTVLDNTLADKMKLNAAGNLDIGGRAYNSSTGGFYMNDGRIQNTITANSSGYEVMMFDNTTENGTVALLQYRTNAAAEGSIIADGSGLAISNNSDYRKKERITDLEGSLDAINSLQPRKYYYRKEFAKPRRAFAGFIAHEVQESQLPHLTTGVKDGVVTQEDLDNDLHSEKIVGDPAYQTVSYSGNEMITRLVGAVQELSEKVEAQQKEIEELKN